MFDFISVSDSFLMGGYNVQPKTVSVDILYLLCYMNTHPLAYFALWMDYFIQCDFIIACLGHLENI